MKLVVIGNGEIGKTTLIARLSKLVIILIFQIFYMHILLVFYFLFDFIFYALIFN